MHGLWRKFSITTMLFLLLASSVSAATTNTAVSSEATMVDASDKAKFPLRSNYTKFEYRISTSDCVKLFTVMYVPKDESKYYPFIMNCRTCGSGGLDQVQSGYGVCLFTDQL